jgi:hypothetical protein
MTSRFPWKTIAWLSWDNIVRFLECAIGDEVVLSVANLPNPTTPETLKSWAPSSTRRTRLSRYALAPLLLVPINLAAHWVLIALYPPENRAVHFNSHGFQQYAGT